MKNTVDPLQRLGKPLWCVYGFKSFPSMICCVLIDGGQHGVIIWGYSVYKGAPAFRTLGVQFESWAGRQVKGRGTVFHFFEQQAHALEFIGSLTKPKKSALGGASK